VRRHGDVCELKGLVFSATDFANTVTHANVSLKIVESAQMIMDGQCSLCTAACENDSICH